MEAVLPYVALVSAFFAAIAVVFSLIRPRFPARVNCWFCQKDLVVEYHERDSWECPHCEQYNGFTADGGYNKILPAHFNSLMNPEPRNQNGVFCVQSKLCQLCARNQELKVQQLALFSPKCEETYDADVKQFRLHLDQMYRLCRECDRNLELKLAQEEQLLKPKVLAWKLTFSKKHSNGARKIMKTVHSKCIHASKCIGYLCSWIIFTLTLVEYWLECSDLESSSDHFENFIRELNAHSQALGVIGLCSSLVTLLLMKRKQFWNFISMILSVLIVSSFFFPLFLYGKLAFTLPLSILNCGEILLDLMKPRKFIKIKTNTLRKGSKVTETFDSKNSSLSTSGLHHSTPKSNSPYDIDISKLDIGPRYKTVSPDAPKSPAPSRCSFARPKPIISPSRFGSNSIISTSNGNLTKASWVAGGYWQSNNWQSPSFAASSPNYSYPLSRSSSQSSGFGSIHTAGYNRSPCESRPGSPFAEIDRLSVFSDSYEPRSADSSLRYHEHLPTSSPAYPNEGDLTKRSVTSPSVIDQETIKKTDVTSSSSHWFVLPFLLGFSLAVNICVFGYFLLHSSSSLATK